MPVICNRPGGLGLKVNDGGQLKRYKLKHGENDIDEAIVVAALGQLPLAMAAALTEGDEPAIQLGTLDPAEQAPPPADELEDDDPKPMTAAEKVKEVKAAECLAELRDLAAGEERKTVTDAIDRRAGELEDE